MIFGKKNNLVGLDIGSGTIRISEIDIGPKGLGLKKIGLLEMPEGAIVEGLIKKPEEIVVSLRTLLEQHHIKERNVAISIGGNKVIVKTIDVQKMSEKAFGEVMPLEAEQYIPFDIEEVNLDFHILGDSTNTSGNMQVLLVAAKKDMIEGYVELVENAGLHPCVVDIDAFALQNIYEVAYHDAKEQHVALIDIGAGKTSLNILQGGISRFMRDISSGCGQINTKITAESGCSAEEAESMKLGKTNAKPFRGNLDEIVKSVVVGWCAEISHALDIYYSTYTDDRIEKIYLSGGGAHLQILHTLLAEQTEIEVKNLNPFRTMRYIDKHLDTGYLQKEATEVTISMGLGIRRVDDK